MNYSIPITSLLAIIVTTLKYHIQYNYIPPSLQLLLNILHVLYGATTKLFCQK